MTQISRRQVAKGTAWSIPAITAAAAAPAIAASSPTPTPVMADGGYVSWNLAYNSTTADGTEGYKWYSTSGGQPGPGACVKNTTAGDTITSYTQTIWLSDSTMTWSAGSGVGANGWSIPAFAFKSQNMTGPDGQERTYYAYTTTWTGSIPTVAGQTCVPAYSFQTNDHVNNGLYANAAFMVDMSVTLTNAGTQSANSGWVIMHQP